MPVRTPQTSSGLTVNPAADNDEAYDHRWVSYALLAVIFFLLGGGLSFLYYNWQTVSSLYLEASQARYEIMSGQRGPVTYLLTHSNLEALQQVAAMEEDILGIEQHEYSTVAKIAFSSANSPAIDMIREHPAVEDMISRNVPMICH